VETAAYVVKKRMKYVHTFLKCKGTETWEETFLNNKWLCIIEQIAHKEINSK